MIGNEQKNLGLPVGEMQFLKRLEQAIPDAEREELATLLNLHVSPKAKRYSAETRGGKISVVLPSLRISVLEDTVLERILYPPPTKEHLFPVLYARSVKEPLNKSDELPEAYREATPFQNEVESKMGPEIYPDPLTSWEEVWPWLHRLFRDKKATSQLDTDRIIAGAIKRQPLTAIPWRQRLRWPHEIVLLVDLSRHLCPYFADYHMLAGNLASWYQHRLKLVFCENAEQQSFFYAGRRYDQFPLCEQNLHILYLGDLGFLDNQKLSPWRWLSLGQDLAGRNARIETLLTVHHTDWRRQHREFFNLHQWDAGSLTGDHGSSQQRNCSWEDGRSHRQTEDLLAALSPAFELTPALVRRVRRLLGFSISVESLVFQHGALRGNFYSFQWRSEEIRGGYTSKLEHLSHDRQRVWEMIMKFERRLPPELQIEQRQKSGRPLTAEHELFLTRLIKSVRENSLDAEATESVLAWVGRMAARSGDEIWGEATTNLFELYRRKMKSEIVPRGVDLSRVSKWIADQAKTWRVAVLQERDLLTFVKDEQVFAGAKVIADFFADDRTTVEIKSQGSTANYSLFLNDKLRDLPLPINSTQAKITTATETVTLRFQPCPSWASGIGRDRFGLFVEVQVQDVSFILRWIQPGSFMMGSPAKEPERFDDEGPQHQVSFALGFWLAETACSQALWRAVMGDNPSRFQDSPEQPVENVSWQMAVDFIKSINTQVPGLALRLPSEAEWEYACRAGKTTPFSFGDKLTTADANYDGGRPYNKGKKGKKLGKTVPVRSFQPNSWGLYQMHGNVWEWCRDHWHGDYKEKPLLDGSVAWEDGSSRERVCRGGSWSNNGGLLRSACRNYWIDDYGYYGLRLARGPDQQE